MLAYLSNYTSIRMNFWLICKKQFLLRNLTAFLCFHQNKYSITQCKCFAKFCAVLKNTRYLYMYMHINTHTSVHVYICSNTIFRCFQEPPAKVVYRVMNWIDNWQHIIHHVFNSNQWNGFLRLPTNTHTHTQRAHLYAP